MGELRDGGRDWRINILMHVRVDGWMDSFDGWMARWMNGWRNGWVELSLLRLVQFSLGSFGRLSKYCLLSSRFFENLVACAFDFIALRFVSLLC